MQFSFFDVRSASDRELTALANFNNRLRVERAPEDPPVPVEEQIQSLRSLPGFLNVYAWRVTPDASNEIIAEGHVVVALTDHNQHMADIEILVLPEYRRQGIARRLLAHLLPPVRQADRRLLTCWSNGAVPSGEAFLLHIGATRGIVSHTNQLVLANVNHDLLKQWEESAAQRASHYRLEWCDGPYPDSEFESVRELLNGAINSMPRGELDMEDSHTSYEELQEREQKFFARDWQRWTVFARSETGAYVGYTEMLFHPNRPYLFEQGGTGVLAEHQNRGLGRWLKAVMLRRAMREKPGLRVVRTNNADTNAPMLAINRALGFAPFSSHTTWQIETDKAFAYLG